MHNFYRNNNTIGTNLKQAKQKFEEYLFKVSVPYIYTLSEEDIMLYGIYQSGNKQIDKDAHKQMTNVYIPTKMILEHFKNGATIRLVNANDIKDIYSTIQEYLEAWRGMLSHGINLSEAPADDLLELDRLAEEIFSRAKYYFGGDEVESVLTMHLNGINRVHSSNFFNESVNTVISNRGNNVVERNGVTTVNPHDSTPELERDSLTDFFKQKMYSTRFRR